MLTPDRAEFLDRETCPVRIDITDSGFPEGIPALRFHERELEHNPWIHRRFGHFVLIDPWGEDLLDVAYGETGLGPLQAQVESFRAHFDELRVAHEAGRVLSDELPERLKQGPLSLDFMTAYELAFDHWLEVVEVLADGSTLVPGAQNAALHAFGDFLGRPSAFDEKACHAVSFKIATTALRNPDENVPTPTSRELSLEDRAAYALARLAKLDVDLDRPDLADHVREWWTEHQADARYRIAWSEDPRLRYGFLR